ncbi:MAG: apolipoprotein N-acyltransferase [Ignavibacteria bacterium]|nr:apolipoprotein N-acyltransferase [Ignavibacteria bacterium]
MEYNTLHRLTFTNKYVKYILSIISGITIGISYPPTGEYFWFFIYFGIILLLYFVYSEDTFRSVFKYTYFSLLISNIIGIYWISAWHSDDTFLKIGGILAIIIHPLFNIIPILIFFFLVKLNNQKKRYELLFFFPFLWVGYEFFDNQWQLNFPWLELGNTEAYNINRIQYIEYTGIHGVSFLICLASSLLLYLFFQIVFKNWKIYSFKSFILFLSIIIILIFPNIFSYFTLKNIQNNINNSYNSDVLSISVIQTNIDPFEKWKGDPNWVVEKNLKGIREALKSNPDLIILNETATPFFFLEDHNLLRSKKFTDIVDSSMKSLLMGIPHLEYYKDTINVPEDALRMSNSGKLYDKFNSAILIEPNSKLSNSTIHKKVKLVPFSEKFPYQSYLKSLKSLFTWQVGISGWQFGKVNTLFNFKSPKHNINPKFSVLICFESVFSDYVRESTKNGAQFLVIITNDGWFGHTSGPIQHERYAVLRAIENRKWVSRCAQTGISCFIDPFGVIHTTIPYGEEGVITEKIILNSEKTFYSENGDILGRISFYLLGSCILILPIYGIFLKYGRK